MLKIRILFYVSILVVFLLSIVNASNISVFNSLSFISDKFVHGAIYFYLTLLGLVCSFKRSNYFVASNIFFLGAFIEIVHFFHPYRFFEYFDLLANLIGVTIALLIFRLKNILFNY
tara:strand:+ start:5388 stop:5735 length:348 start_codon:yes stop_codon:yes gene_type:complete